MNNLEKIGLAILISVTISLRFINLGYSQYQGDEVRALFTPEPGQTFANYLMDQKKGPVQFVITHLTKLIDPTYHNEMLNRIPFALAGVLAIFFFYKLARIHFGKKIAFYSSMFISINGLFVAFSRMIQYQSFVIMFSILALYLFSLSLKKERLRISGIYYGMFFWALSILSHYDGVFIAPFAAYLIYKWLVSNNIDEFKFKFRHLVISAAISGVLLALFYIPFILSISQGTIAYWLKRFRGTEVKISSSNYTFSIYNPIYALESYVALTFLSLLNIKKSIWVLLWFIVPYFFMEVIMDVPGTHIYTYIIPASILMGIGISSVFNIFSKLSGNIIARSIEYLLIVIVLSFFFLQSYFIFVDNKVEYPWEGEDFFRWTFDRPANTYHLSLFGFPYSRGWDEIYEYMSIDNRAQIYSTNENKLIAKFYIPYKKDTNNAGYYVLIHRPQSLQSIPFQDKAQYWIKNYDPVKIIYNNNKEVAYIYLMPQGNLDQIMEKGY